MKARRWVRRVSLGVLATLLLLIAGVAWLLGTTSGAEFIVAQAVARLPVDVSVGAVRGSLLRGLQLEQFELRVAPVAVEANRLEIRVDPSVLLNFRLVLVDRLHADGLTVLLPEADATDSPAPLFSDIVVPGVDRLALPIDIVVRSFVVRDGAIVRGDTRAFGWDELTLSGSFADSALSKLDLTLASAPLRVVVSGEVEIGDAFGAELDTQWSYSDPEVALSGAATIRGDRSAYRVSHTLEGPHGIDAAGQIRVPVDQPMSLSLDARADAGRWETPQGQVQWQTWRFGLEGELSALAVTGGGSLSVDDYPQAQVAAEATASGDVIQIAELVARSGLDSRARASGRVNFATSTFEGLVELAKIPLDPWLAVNGRLDSGDFAVSGAWGASPRLELAMRQTQGTWNDYPLSAQGRVAYANRELAIDSLNVSLGENLLAVDGRWSGSQGVALEGRWRAPRLDRIGYGLGGASEGEFELSGQIDAPELAINASVNGLQWQALEVGAANMDGAWRDGKVALDLNVTDAAYDSIEVAALSLDAQGDQQQHSLKLRASADPFEEIELAANGRWSRDAGWSGLLTKAQAVVATAATDPIAVSLADPAALAWNRDAIRLDAMCLNAANIGDGCFTVDWDGSAFRALSGRLPALDLAALSGMTRAYWRLDGAVAVDFDLEGAPDALSGQLTVRTERAALKFNEADPAITFDSVDLVSTWRSGALDAELVTASGRDSNLSARLEMPQWLSPTTPLSVHAELSLTNVSRWDPAVEFLDLVDGSARVVVDVDGTRADPQLRVDARVVDAALNVIPLNVALAAVQVSLVGDDIDALQLDVSADSGEGQVSFDGVVGLVQSQPFLSGKLEAVDALLADLEEIRIVSSADLSVNWHPSSVTIQGDASIDDSQVIIRTLPETAVTVSPDAVVVRRSATDELEQQRFRHINVAVTLEDDVRLSGFGLDTKVAGRMRIRQYSDGTTSGVGRLRLNDATYQAYGQTLSVTRGILDFNGPIEQPNLSVRAEREIDNGRVGIDITGTPDSLSSELFSDPPRSDAEKLSLLLTGRALASADQSEGASLADAAITLGLRQAFGVSSAIRDGVGLDRLGVDGNGRDGRILAGKQLSESIYLQYAYGVFDQISSVLLRFRINDRLALESVSGEEQSLDLIYEVGRTR